MLGSPRSQRSLGQLDGEEQFELTAEGWKPKRVEPGAAIPSGSEGGIFAYDREAIPPGSGAPSVAPSEYGPMRKSPRSGVPRTPSPVASLPARIELANELPEPEIRAVDARAVITDCESFLRDPRQDKTSNESR